jgi:hypothetical protein
MHLLLKDIGIVLGHLLLVGGKLVSIVGITLLLALIKHRFDAPTCRVNV